MNCIQITFDKNPTNNKLWPFGRLVVRMRFGLKKVTYKMNMRNHIWGAVQSNLQEKLVIQIKHGRGVKLMVSKISHI